MKSDTEILKERSDLIVYRDGEYVVKESRNAESQQEFRNAWRFMKMLEFTGCAPEPISLSPGRLVMSYIPDEPVTDEVEYIRNAIHLLWTLRHYRIRHGDTTYYNLRVVNNRPVLIDFDESITLYDTQDRKRPQSDSDHFWPAILTRTLDTTRRIRRWMVIRNEIRYYLGWGRFDDVGTYEGDFCGLATTEGLYAKGIDQWTGGRTLWEYMKKDMIQSPVDIMECDFPNVEIRLLLSVWPYLVEKYGEDKSNRALSEMIQHSELMFFEAQLRGDGPGTFESHESIGTFLQEISNKPVSEVGRFPVAGRPFSRGIWKIGESG